MVVNNYNYYIYDTQYCLCPPKALPSLKKPFTFICLKQVEIEGTLWQKYMPRLDQLFSIEWSRKAYHKSRYDNENNKTNSLIKFYTLMWWKKCWLSYKAHFGKTKSF